MMDMIAMIEMTDKICKMNNQGVFRAALKEI